jgi:hypothetical protein
MAQLVPIPFVATDSLGNTLNGAVLTLARADGVQGNFIYTAADGSQTPGTNQANSNARGMFPNCWALQNDYIVTITHAATGAVQSRWVAAVNRPPLVSALPAFVVDGDEVYYQNAAMATAGIVWHLRYNAGSASAYKWEFLGGQDMVAPFGAAVALNTAGSWVIINPGQQLVVPLNGSYEIGYQGLSVAFGANGNTYMDVNWSIAKSTAPATALMEYGRQRFQSGQYGYDGNSYSARMPAAYTFTAGDILKLSAISQGLPAAGIGFSQGTILMRPIRVS